MVGTKILLIIGVILIVGYFLMQEGVLDGVIGSKKKLTCDITLSNSLLLGPKIKGNPRCDAVSVNILKCIGLSSASPLGIIEQDVTVTLSAGGEQHTKIEGVSRIPFDDKTVTLNVCVIESTNTGSIRLVNKGELVDSRNLNF